eukprot:scaffold74371_cov69-Phaeocystis_antarctica.AAC.6
MGRQGAATEMCVSVTILAGKFDVILKHCIPRLSQCPSTRERGSEAGLRQPRENSGLTGGETGVAKRRVAKRGWPSQENTTGWAGWATRVWPPSVWPPRFRHLEFTDTVLPRAPRSR